MIHTTLISYTLTTNQMQPQLSSLGAIAALLPVDLLLSSINVAYA